jgi:uncharacterized protein (TIGR02246 family)
MRKIVVLAVTSLALGSLAAAQTKDPALVARANEYKAAMKAKDAAKIATLYTEDAVIFYEGSITRGRSAIQKDYEQVLTGSPDISIVEAQTENNIGYAFGTFSFPAEGPDKKPRSGHYVEIWKRVGGQWLIAYDTFSNGPTPK